MNLLLTMAGRYQRFREFSYEIPKFLLPLSNRTVLHFILKSFQKTFRFNRVVLVANKMDRRFRSQIESTLEEFGFRNSHLIFIDDTRGQSESALQGLKFLSTVSPQENNLPICIHNIDTVLQHRNFQEIKRRLTSADCIIDTFEASNESYSYVLERNSSVTSIVEKKVVSDHASSGCYCFKNLDLCLKYLDHPEHLYISEAINLMIEDDLNVETFLASGVNNTIVLGTPEEYLNSMEFFHLSVNEKG